MSFEIKARSLILPLILLVGLTPCLVAQKGASRLEGTVKDSTGGVVPTASVVARNMETGIAREVFSSEAGTYVFASLPPGTYSVAVEMAGFKRAVAENVKCDVAAVVVQNFTLEVGQLAETVTVTAAGAAPIATTTSDVADTVQGQTIVSLPLNGRNPLELVQLNAGIAGSSAMSEKGSSVDQSQNRGGLGANGARAVNNAVYLDGVDITNSEGGTGEGITTAADLSQSVDAIGEFRVISANPTAEFGKNSGMQIEIVTRSGTNDFHGSLYEFHRNTSLNANQFFNNMLGIDRGKLIRNQFGGTIGGPVMLPWMYNGKNKTFFFFNYEGFRERRGAIAERSVLTQTARQGIFRYYTDGSNSVNLVDSNTGQVRPEYAGKIANFDVVQADLQRWDGIGKDTSGVVDRYVNLTPLPNYYGLSGEGRDGLNFATYRFNTPDPDDRNTWVVKVDHVFNSKHTASVRYSNGYLTRLADFAPFPDLPTNTRDEYQRGISVNVISNLTPTITNEFRFGFTRNRREYTSQLNPGQILLDLDSTFDGLGTTNPDLTRESSTYARMTYQATNNISWAHKNHLFKGGVTFRTFPLNRRAVNSYINWDSNSEPRNEQMASVNLAQLFGTTDIPIPARSDQIAASNYFNFYLGRLGGATTTFNATSTDTWGTYGSARVRGFRSKEWGFFFQDDWRVSSKLTLNLGVRYELFGVPYEVNSFFTTMTNRKLLDPQVDVTYDAPPVEFGAIGPKTGQQLYPSDYNNFAPTVGFSYDPFGQGKTAIRAAYRISYDRLFSGTVDTIDGSAPGLQADSVMNGDALRDAGAFVRLAPGGLNAGLAMTPRWEDIKGTAVGGIALKGPFDFNKFLASTRSQGGPLTDKPLGTLTETRNSAGPYEFASDLRTAYGQSWSFSIQHEIMRGTVVEARYIGRKGLKEYMGVPSNEFRMPAEYLQEVRELQYLLTGGSLGLKPGSFPEGVQDGQSITIDKLFGTTPSTATDYSQHTRGIYDSYAFQHFPNLYPFFLAGNNAFDTAMRNPIVGNDFVSTTATIDNNTNQFADAFYISVPKDAVPSGTGLNPRPPDRQPEADIRGRYGALPIIVGVQKNIFRPNPQFLNGPRATVNAGWSNYHAMQLQVQRRFYQGLQFQANYTWSKNLDVTSVSEPTGQDAVAFFCRSCDYSYSDNDITHNFKTNFIWDIPFGRDRRWLNSMNPVLDHVLGGWQIASYLEAATDFPLNVAVNGTDRTAPPTGGGIRPSWAPGVVHDKELSQIGEVTRTENGVFYFTPADFEGLMTRTLIGELGNVPRNYWRGPGYFNVDMTLSKFFAIQEEKTLEFRAEFFNMLNHVNFGNPVLNANRGPYVDLSKSDAGQITSQLGNPRLIQFALKFRF